MPRKPDRPPLVCEYYTWRLFQRDGVYYADGRSGQHHLGKHSLATRDADEALANLRRLDRQIAVKSGLAPATTLDPSSDLAIAAGWELFLARCQQPEMLGGVSAGTFKRYRAVKDKHIAFFESKGLRRWIDVDKDSAVAYARWLEQQRYAPRSIYLEITLLKSVILFLVGEKHLPATCRLTLPIEKPSGTDTYCYRQQEVAAMLAHCQANPDIQWLAPVLIGLACTGLRIGELAGLRWTDLDLETRMIRLTDDRSSHRRKALGTARRLKGRRGRVLPIHADFFAALVGMERHADGLVFHGPRGGRLKPDTVRNIFIRDVIGSLKERFPTVPGEIGFAHGRLHAFRHYFCSQAFLGGAAEADIRDWLGHADSKMVAHYRHLRDEDSRRKMQQIDFLGQDGRTERLSG